MYKPASKQEKKEKIDVKLVTSVMKQISSGSIDPGSASDVDSADKISVGDETTQPNNPLYTQSRDQTPKQSRKPSPENQVKHDIFSTQNYSQRHG